MSGHQPSVEHHRGLDVQIVEVFIAVIGVRIEVLDLDAVRLNRLGLI